MPWFRANMTTWLYEYAKKHVSKHNRVYSAYQLDIGGRSFQASFLNLSECSDYRSEEGFQDG